MFASKLLINFRFLLSVTFVFVIYTLIYMPCVLYWCVG